MTNGNTKSLGTILWRVLKNPLALELTYEEAAEYALEFIRLLGAPVAYENKITNPPLQLYNYRTEIPCDILYIEGVRYTKSGEENYIENQIAMREASNTFHMKNSTSALDESSFDEKIDYKHNEFTYKIQKNILYSSIKNGFIEISYKAISTDEEGYPLIPDNETVFLGMEYYILSRYLEPLWLMGKITDKAFEYIQQKRYFYMPSAYTSLQMPNADKLETIMNSINKLIINTTAHQNFYKKLGEKERVRQFR